MGSLLNFVGINFRSLIIDTEIHLLPCVVFTMIRNLLLISLVTLAGTAGLSPIAYAKPVSSVVSFKGTVAKECTVTTKQNGTLQGNREHLPTGFVTYTPGLVEAVCNSAPAKVKSDPDQSSYPGLYLESALKPKQPVYVTEIGKPKQYEVELFASNGDIVLPPGNYNFTVTVTVTPP